MIIRRANPLGGRPLQDGSFPLSDDKQGNFGLKVGYLESGEPILIAIRDAEKFATQFGMSLKEYKKILNKHNVPLLHRIAYYLLGKRTYYKVMNEGFEEGD
jgi:hypothetical protein